MSKHEQRSVLQASTSVESHEILGNETSAPIATPQRRSSGRGDATLWMLLGLVSIVMGVALAATPGMSWTASRIAGRLGEMGVHSDVLVVGGVLLMVLALVRRSQEATRAEMQYDSSLLFEQIATELVEIRGAIEAISGNSGALQQELGDVRKQVEQSHNALAAEVERHAPRENSDALFQLASGLDKLGLRFEQRLRLHHTTLQESVDELAATIEHTRRSLEERLDSRPEQLGSAAAELGEHPAHSAGYETAPYESVHDEAPSDGHAQPEAREAQAPEQAESSGRSLGLLDQFEDAAPPPALPTSLATRTDEEFGVADASQTLDRAAKSARGGAWDEELMVERNDDADTQSKLAQLNSLLSDDRLRAALDSMRRQA